MQKLVLQGRTIGDGSPMFVIAEAGVNHNGDPDVAHRLVDAAAEAGVDAVKFQTFDPDELVTADAPKAQYPASATGDSESQQAMLRRLTLSYAAHEELKRHAEDRGLLFLSTPFENASADFLERLGVVAFKVASGEVTNHPFLAYLAGKRKPLLLSTGMSDLSEVEGAVAAIRQAGAPPLALLHCTSSYPAPIEDTNLRALATMRARFELPVGYSDHTLGPVVAIGAVCFGASILEKHLTLDCKMPGPDHAASMEPGPFAALVRDIRAIESALGDGIKRVRDCERDTQRVARKSLFAGRALAAGHVLSPGDLVARRPGTGIPPSALGGMLGRKVRRALEPGAMIGDGDLE